MKADEDRASGAALFEPARNEARLRASNLGAGLDLRSGSGDRPLSAFANTQGMLNFTIEM